MGRRASPVQVQTSKVKDVAVVGELGSVEEEPRVAWDLPGVLMAHN